MKIHTMDESDISRAAILEREAFSEPWSEDAFRDSLKLESSIFFAAEAEGMLLGYAGAYLILDEADITNVVVAPEWRRRGVASELLEALLAEAKSRGAKAATLEVRKSNAAAIALYEKKGFVSAGIRKRFYRCPTEDAVIMWNQAL